MRKEESIQQRPIGVFDSGYGGLTVYKALEKAFPMYDFVYLGDNARSPYGTRSFETIYRFTEEGVAYLMQQAHCPLVILACNTASARALRQIQQTVFIPWAAKGSRVLGVIRPTIEALSPLSQSKHVGIMATPGTVASQTYLLESAHHCPELSIVQEACPLLVPLIENGELDNAGVRYFVHKYVSALLKKDEQIDSILLACTHYPLLQKLIEEEAGSGIQVVSQGEIVANSLQQYLQRHPEMEQRLSRSGQHRFLSTEQGDSFERLLPLFLGRTVETETVEILGNKL